MTAALVPVAEHLPASPNLSETLERAAGYARAARADNTPGQAAELIPGAPAPRFPSSLRETV